MKRYLVFKGIGYEPSGGMEDFFIDTDTVYEGIKAIYEDLRRIFNLDKNEYIEYVWEIQWAHIYDTVERKIVWKR